MPSTQHDWVRYTQQAVDVIVDPLGGEPYSVDRPNEPIGECYGCRACGAPMRLESMTLTCEPVDLAAA